MTSWSQSVRLELVRDKNDDGCLETDASSPCIKGQDCTATGVPGMVLQRLGGPGGPLVTALQGVVPMTYTARVVYNLNSPFGYSRYNWTMSISGSHAGQTESAVMHKLKDRHGWDADITILSIDWR